MSYLFHTVNASLIMISIFYHDDLIYLKEKLLLYSIFAKL